MIKKYKISTSSVFGKCLKANSQINKNELIIDLKKNHIPYLKKFYKQLFILFQNLTC